MFELERLGERGLERMDQSNIIIIHLIKDKYFILLFV